MKTSNLLQNKTNEEKPIMCLPENQVASEKFKQLNGKFKKE
jgi:hypothetical protein